jgi:pimeloyl-ACP methyl ester carboxylesterase
MPEMHHQETTIYYEEYGSGYPLLLIAPGGLNSTIDAWDRAAINPVKTLANDFRLIAMDQRNAGRSVGPFPTASPWDAYCSDQLALMDHLQLTHFHVMGCCIGGPYGLKIAHTAPTRVTAAVLEQPMGMVAANQAGWISRSQTWAKELAATRDDLDENDGLQFIDEMWTPEFVACLTREQVGEIKVPLCVLPGIDEIHPTEVGREIGKLVDGAVVIEPWKDTAAHTASATVAVREFLLEHTPMTR